MSEEMGGQARRDRFVHDDAAYVLGALSPQEQADFEEHLRTCPDCAARVRELAILPDLLAGVPLDEVDADVPDTLLPGLLRRARSERRRRHWVTGGLTGVAAACLIAMVVAVWPSSPAPSPHRQAMVAVVASPIRATAALADQPWGTEISLDCSYSGTAVPSDWVYGLTVIDRAGTSHRLGTWTLVAGQDTRFPSGTALHRNQIARIEITAPDGSPILQLTT